MPSLDKDMNVVIIGLGVGGLYASKAATSVNRKASVTMIEKRDFDMFSPCGLPYAIEEIIPNFDALKHEVPVTGRTKKMLSTEVLSIDAAAKSLSVRSLKTSEVSTIPYDSLIIATGAAPVVIPVPGVKELRGKGVYYVSNPTDAAELKGAAGTSKLKEACVIGAGAIGLEVAVALKELGLKVHVIEKLDRPFFRSLDPDMAPLIKTHLEQKGLDMRFGIGLESVNGSTWVDSITAGGQKIPCDVVVMSVGMRPNVDLAKTAGIEIGRSGIVTNDRMETSVKGIYAVGDCAQSFWRIDGRPGSMQLATAAYRMGQIAGANAAGGEARYKGILNTFVSKVGELEIAATGYTSEGAAEAGLANVKAISTKGLVRPHWMPGSEELNIMVIVDGGTGRILGAQAIGKEGAAWRINVLSMAVTNKLTLQDLADSEFAYCPPVADVYDVLSLMAEIGIKRLRLSEKK